MKTRLYLPGLLGLRFIAAFTVYFGHLDQAIGWAGLPVIPGYTSAFADMPNDGVTLFFVLSGFLITYLLLTEQDQTGTIAIGRFYRRRILRIWPLYYAFVALTFFVLPHIAYLSWEPNLDMAINGHYWERLALYIVMSPHVAVTLFMHPGVAGPLWSVGTEEYFYALWPQLVARIKTAQLPAGLAAVVLVPLAVHFWGGSYLSLFFDSFRIDCMAIGGFAAWIALRRNAWLQYVFTAPVQAVAYVIAVLHLFTLSHDRIYDDLYSTLFAVIIVNLSLNPKSVVSLENRFFRFMGEISYGFYVFQWLVNVFVMKTYLTYFHITNDLVRDGVFLTSTFGLTTALAAASYYGWERPFLKLKDRFAVITSGASARGYF